MRLPYDHKLVPLAKSLRKRATPQENHLWYDFLRSHPVRFQRQKTIGQFIADFYCEKARLVIELDGAQHYTPEHMQYDAQRTAALEALHLEVLRFSNSDIDQRFPAVCKLIDATINTRILQPEQEKEGSP